MKDYYSILGVSDDERRLQGDEFGKVLKKKFRALCLECHPDRQVGKSEDERKAAEDRFKEVNEAYSVLSDPQKRSQYDMYGTVGGSADPGFGGMDDISEFMRRHMEDMGFGGMGGFGNFGGTRAPQAAPGSDMKIRVECTLEDVYRGASKKVRYSRQVRCPDCGGSGSADGKSSMCPHCHGSGMETKVTRVGYAQMMESHPCQHCGGTGYVVSDPCKKCGGSGLVTETETVSFDIPPEIRDGYAITLRGKGCESQDPNGADGNLIVVVSVKRNDMFSPIPNTADLMCVTEVGIVDCITGCTREVSTIGGGKARIEIPAGAKEGSSVVVPGAGMPKGRGGYGNMVVYISQVMPGSLDKDERKALEKLSKMKHFKV